MINSSSPWTYTIRLLRGLMSSRVTRTRTHTHTHTYTHTLNRPDLVVSEAARSARILHHPQMENKQVGSRDLWGTLFQRNGFMEMRVKRSIVHPLIGSLWSTDTCPPRNSPTWNHVIWEGVTVHPNHGRDMTCCRLPLSVKYLCQHRRIALMAVKTLTHALSLLLSLSLSLSLSLFLFPLKFNQNRKTEEKHKNKKT